MERETIEVAIGGHKFLVKSYATERDISILQEEVDSAQREMKGSALVQAAMARGAVKAMLVSFDGDTENASDRVINSLQYEHYVSLVEKIDEIIAKKNSSLTAPSAGTAVGNQTS